MTTLSRPQLAVFFLPGVAMQLPTPTPAPEIPLSDIERIISTSAAKAQELNLQQMTFVIVVLAFVLAIAYMVYLIRRPNKPAADITAVEAMAGVLSTVQKQAELDQKTRIEQNDKFIETAVLMNDGVNRNADNTKQLNAIVDRLATHTEQLAGRQNERDKKLDSMSTALDKVVAMAETIQAAANEIKAAAVRIEGRQSELQQAIDAIRQTERTLTEIKEDSGSVATVSALDAEGAAGEPKEPEQKIA